MCVSNSTCSLKQKMCIWVGNKRHFNGSIYIFLPYRHGRFGEALAHLQHWSTVISTLVKRCLGMGIEEFSFFLIILKTLSNVWWETEGFPLSSAESTWWECGIWELSTPVCHPCYDRLLCAGCFSQLFALHRLNYSLCQERCAEMS